MANSDHKTDDEKWKIFTESLQKVSFVISFDLRLSRIDGCKHQTVNGAVLKSIPHLNSGILVCDLERGICIKSQLYFASLLYYESFF